MVDGIAYEHRGLASVEGIAGYVPGPRISPENRPQRAHRAPLMGELIAEAHRIVQRDNLPSNGYLVVQRKGSAIHRHHVWLFGPFALLDDGWFGQVHGLDISVEKPSRWLKRHERRCREQHWTHFRWIDPAGLDSGCGARGIGLGLSADGPTYCATPGATGADHEPHVLLADLLRRGLRELAQGSSSLAG